MEQDVVEQAKALHKIRGLLPPEGFGQAKKQLLDCVKEFSHLTALMEIDGFMDNADVIYLKNKLTPHQVVLAPVAVARAPVTLGSGLDVTTALCLIVTVKEDEVNSIRSVFDKAFKRWPPHVNLFFPFVPHAAFDEYAERIGRAIESFGDFELLFDKPAFFSQGKGQNTFNLQPKNDAKLQVQKFHK
jgi:hypothetical protein